jgi:flagellar biogenesis protein FliO
MELTAYYKMVLSLGVILGIMYFAARFAKRFTTHHYRGELKVLDRMAMSQNVALTVVEYKSKSYLMSVSPSGITILETFDAC